MPAVLFLSLLIFSNFAFAQIRTDPFGLSADVGTATSCIMSAIVRMFLASLPPGVTLLLIYKFLQIERKKDTGEVYVDEIISILVMGMFITIIFHLLFVTYEYFGIPVRELYGLIYYCDANFNPSCSALTSTGLIATCNSSPFGSFQFALSVLVAFARIFFFIAPTLVIIMITYKSYQKHSNDYKKGNKGITYAFMAFFTDGVIALIAVMAYFDMFLKFFFIDYGKMIEMYFRMVGFQNI